MMRTSYDPKDDAFCARFVPENVAIVSTDEVAPGVMIDLYAFGNMVGIEVLSVSVRGSGVYNKRSADFDAAKPRAAE